MLSGTTLNTQTFALSGSQEEKRERDRKDLKTIFEEIIAEDSSNMENVIVN